MERVTVHLEAIGTRHFTGPGSLWAAQQWAAQEIGRRDKVAAKPVESHDPDMPKGVSQSQWRAYCTPATAKVLGALAGGGEMGTQEVSDCTGYSRPTVNRILAVARVLGIVARERKSIGRRRGDFWRLM